MIIGTKCIITSDLIDWYFEDLAIYAMPLLLKLGEEAEVIYISSDRSTAMLKGLESGVILAGIPLEIIEKIRVKR